MWWLAFGGLLRSKPRDDWENVLKSNIWNLQGMENNVLPVLRLSYYHLPSQLKRCFAYCAIFPKDYQFEMKELVLVWMAEGLIEQRDDQKHMEDTGEDYFQDLLSRSLFQSSSYGRFAMHDCVNDLAQFVAGDTCFRLENKQFKKEKARHSFYIPGRYDRFQRFESFVGIKCLRTFMPLPIPSLGCGAYYLANNVVSDLLPKLRCLRALSFRHYQINKLPDSIGDLKHLRYLDLSYTEIVTLPKIVTSLCNLQTMLLKRCRYLKKLPSEMQNLVNLRHLDVEGVDLVEGMPLGIEELRSIRTLPIFFLGKGNEASITALMNLKYLQGALCISMLENVANASDLRGEILMDKERIDDLVLRWIFNDAPEATLDRGILEKLKPHGNLKNLTIMGYGGTEFPSWVGDALFHNLTKLKLEHCKKCTTLPHLGLLSSLKNLVIEGFPSVKKIDSEFNGGSMSNSNPFPALETLQFENMDEWEDWKICGVEFPYLRELSVVRCPKLLGKLPNHLPSLEKLRIEYCYQLVVSFQSLPVISELIIKGCKEVELSRDCSSPNYMCIWGVSFLFPVEEFMQGLINLKQLRVGWELYREIYLPCWIFQEGLPHIVVENKELFRKGKCGGEIEVLELKGNCDILEDLFISSTQSDFPSKLRVIRFSNCDALASFPVFFSSLCLEDLEIRSCQSLISIGRHQLPPTLKRLEIFGCKKLQSLLNEEEASSSCRDKDEKRIICDTNYEFQNLEDLEIGFCESLTSLGNLPASLKYLKIRCCESLISIGRHQLPPTLKRLKISGCKKLQSLLNEEEASSSCRDKDEKSISCDTNCAFLNLEYLMITDCKSLTSLGNLPASLKYLEMIASYPVDIGAKLESIAASFDSNTALESIKIWKLPNLKYLPKNMCKLTNLHEIEISRCPVLVSFPQGGLPTAHLKKLKVYNCEKLEALPGNMQSLTTLQELAISKCPGIKSIPEEGLPTDLTSLFLDDVNFCKPLFEWGLHRLTSLKKLRITGGCSEVVSFPQDEIDMKLPTSLISLTIESFPNLKYFSTKGFQSLTSLENLSIRRCPKLESLPKNGLPPSLLKLYIICCPLLERRCQKDKGRESLKIARIPAVWYIDPLIR